MLYTIKNILIILFILSNMKLRQIQKDDQDLILDLDDIVYPLSKENKINYEIIDR